MKYALLATVLALASLVFALDGQIGIHDPSTVVRCNGKYYTYGTGGSSLVSDDGWTWRRGATLPRRGLAPDVIHIGDRYYVYVAANIGAQPKAAINMISNKTLDPDSPDYKWEEGGVVASSDGVEDCNAIDPGVFLDPTDGRLWLVYGSYFGYIRLVELDPKTGKRLNPNDQPARPRHQLRSVRHDVSRWLVLPAGHARQLLPRRRLRLQHSRGPREEGHRSLPRPRGRRHDPGRRQAVRRIRRPRGWPRPFRPPRSRRRRAEVLSPLRSRPRPGRRQRAGYPPAAVERRLAGRRRELEGRHLRDRIRAHRYGARACRGGYAGGRTARPGRQRRRWTGAWPRRGPGGGGGGRGMFAGTGAPIPPQDVAEVSKNWPAGNIDVRMANYLCQAQQKWTIARRPQRRRLPRLAVFQDHHRRHGPCAGRHRGR